jgi:Cu(I)/Ag(I) efflux system periplasmic protein CusF
MIRSLCIALGLALALAACKPHAASGTGKGTVAGVDVGKGEVTLDHGNIPGVMGAMVMTFSVRDPKILANVTPGEKVEFDLEHVGDDYFVTAIRPR